MTNPEQVYELKMAFMFGSVFGLGIAFFICIIVACASIIRILKK